MWLLFVLSLASLSELPEVDFRFCVFDERTGESLDSTISLRTARNTDEQGRLVVHRPWSNVRTSADGCADARVGEEVHQATIRGPHHYARELRFDPRESSSMDIELEPFEARPQTVVVVDRATGEPVESARVLMEYGGDESGPGSPEGRTDIHGLVVFETLADGPYWLQVAGQPRIEFLSLDVVLDSERRVIEAPVRINPRVLVVGRVVDATGAPVEGVRIRAAKFRSKTWTQEDGSFEVYAFATSRASVHASKPGLGTATAPIRSEGVDWDVVDVGELVLQERSTVDRNQEN